jgi:hypothetical protein
MVAAKATSSPYCPQMTLRFRPSEFTPRPLKITAWGCSASHLELQDKYPNRIPHLNYSTLAFRVYLISYSL